MDEYILRNEGVLNRVKHHIVALEVTEPPKWVVSIKPYRKDLTRQQRNYWHKCIDIISKFNGDTPEDLKMEIKFRVLPLTERIINGSKRKWPPSTESITREQYSELIEATLMIAGELELTMPSPQHYGYKGE